MREIPQANQILLFTSGYEKTIIGMIKTTKSFSIKEQDQLYSMTLTNEKVEEARRRFGGDWESNYIVCGFMEYLIDKGLAKEVIAPLQVNYTDSADRIEDINEI